MTTALELLAALAVSAAPTPADADAAAYTGQSSSGVRYYDFDDDDIEGEVLSADGVNIVTRGHVRHASLINLRPHFIYELTRLALDT